MGEKEIDLLDLLINIVRFIKRRFLLFTLSLIIGIAFGYVNYSITDNTYSTNVYSSCIDINKQLLYEFINPIKSDILKENYTEASKRLNISSDLVNNLKGFDIDTSWNHSLKINLLVSDINETDSLARSIISYINNIKMIKSVIEKKYNNSAFIISKIENELVRLDKTQELFLNNLENNNSEILISQTANINEQSIRLYEKKLRLEDEILLIKPSEIYSDMEYVFTPQNSLYSKIFYGALGFLFIGFIIAIILEFNAVLKRR